MSGGELAGTAPDPASGRPSTGSRACRWTIAAPASAAPIAASAISFGVIGRCGDIDGVWIEPVTAQVTMTLRAGMGVTVRAKSDATAECDARALAGKEFRQ